MNRQQVNLLQPPFRRAHLSFSAATMLRASAAVVVGILLVYAVWYWQLAAQRRDLHQMDIQNAALAKRVDDLSRKIKPREKNPQLEKEVARAEREVASLSNVRQVVQEKALANTRGYSEYLVALARQHVPGVWLTGLDITGAAESVRLQGRTIEPDLVLRYVERLSAEPSLAGTEFQIFQMTRPKKDKDSKELAPYVDFLIRTAVRDKNTETGKP
jgi:Tfp pilus assembly protein PilN